MADEAKNLMDWFRDDAKTELRSDVDGFPEGDTVIDLAQTKIESTIIPFQDGTTKKRFIIHFAGKKYWAGKKIMQGIEKAIKLNAKKVRITRQGLDMQTVYVVVPLLD